MKKPAAKTTTAPKKLTQTTLKTTKAAASKKRAKESDVENSDPEDQDNSLASNSPPLPKKQKKAPAPKKSSKGPLEPIRNESMGMDGANDDFVEPQPKKGSSTDQYQKAGCGVCYLQKRVH